MDLTPSIISQEAMAMRFGGGKLCPKTFPLRPVMRSDDVILPSGGHLGSAILYS